MLVLLVSQGVRVFESWFDCEKLAIQVLVGWSLTN